ncbi:hypothetical protein GF325_14345 [Candidatus Bathyarchaeota archaeon]|nr:hypothetical protein [Candidatus Bathyarchaeota archaeon]
MMTRCDNCGRENTNPKAKFCISCGKPLPKPDKLECPKCGNFNGKNNIFCITCGTRLRSQAVEWSESDLTVANSHRAPAQWKSDSNLVFCPNCNYACRKDWDTCPMCATIITGADAFQAPSGTASGTKASVEVPEAGNTVTPGFSPSKLKEMVATELESVIKGYGVISIASLARKVNAPERDVLGVIKDMIVTGEIEGHVDKATNEFVSEIPIGTHSPIPSTTVPLGGGRISDLSSIIKKERNGNVDELVKDLVQSLELKRGYEFEGGRVHFKITLKNNSKVVIHDIKVYLDVPEFFKIEDDEMALFLPSLSPTESRGLDFYLEPKKCGHAGISATVLFKDIYGKRHAKLVRPLDVHVKSPIITASKSSIEYVKQRIASLASDMKMFAIQGLDPELLFNAAFRAISRFDMACIHDVKDDISLEAWFSAVSKIDDEPIVTRIIVSTKENILEIRVWCDDDKQLTGFLAKIIGNLRDEIELIKRIRNEDKKKALKLMELSRNFEILKNYAGLNWEAGEINNALLIIQHILERTFGANEIGQVMAEILEWQDRLETMDGDQHISESEGDQLYNDVERWQKLINLELGAYEGA